MGLFFVVQLALIWSRLENLDDKKLQLQAEIATIERKREQLQLSNWDLQRENHRLGKHLEQLEQQSAIPATRRQSCVAMNMIQDARSPVSSLASLFPPDLFHHADQFSRRSESRSRASFTNAFPRFESLLDHR